MICGVCPHCGDTYPFPLNMDENREYTCFVCGKNYSPKLVSMEEFVYIRLKTTKM